MREELDVTDWIGDPEAAEKIQDAFDNASDQDKITWLTENGKRIAAIVPVDVAEEHERQIEAVLATPVEGWVEVPGCPLNGHAQHELARIIYRPTPQTHAHWTGDRGRGHQAFMHERAAVRETEAAGR